MTNTRTKWVAALVVLTLTSPLRADYLPPWTYSWSATPLSVLSDPPGTGNINLTNDQGSAVGATKLVATNLQTLSSAATSNPDMFTNGGQYKLVLTITDTQSGQMGTFEIDGKLSGSISSGSAQVTNQFTSVLSKTLDLGNTAYTVTAESFLPPGPPSSSNSGGIGADVKVAALSPGDPNPSGFGTPEPSSLLLCSLGAAGCAFARWRRRRSSIRPPVIL